MRVASLPFDLGWSASVSFVQRPRGTPLVPSIGLLPKR